MTSCRRHFYVISPLGFPFTAHCIGPETYIKLKMKDVSRLNGLKYWYESCVLADKLSPSFYVAGFSLFLSYYIFSSDA